MSRVQKLARQKSLKKLKQTQRMLNQLNQQLPKISRAIPNQSGRYSQHVTRIQQLAKRLQKYQQKTEKERRKRSKKKQVNIQLTQSIIIEEKPDGALKQNLEKQQIKQELDKPKLTEQKPKSTSQKKQGQGLSQQEKKVHGRLNDTMKKINQFLDSGITVKKFIIIFLVMFSVFVFFNLSPACRILIWKLVKGFVPPNFANPIDQFIKQSQSNNLILKKEEKQVQIFQKIADSPQMTKQYCLKGKCVHGIIEYKSFNSKIAKEVIQNDL